MSGLRERKKQRTRETIASTAARLFARDGFAAVTIDEIARTADVSRQTVFNYFPTKESMLFDRDAELQESLVSAIRDRPPGMPLTEAMRAHTHAFWNRLAELLAEGPLPHGFWSVVRQTPSLQAYAVTMAARHAAAVAAQLAAERGADPDDPVCAAVAQSLCAVDAAVFRHGMNLLTDGEAADVVVATVLADADEGYDLLAGGVDGFT